VIEARYTHGITHINEDDNGDGDRIKNRVFSLTVGFRLR
jgi:predicted small metal-binding protein